MNQVENFDRLVCTDAIRRDLRFRSVRAAGFTWAAGIADFVLRIGSTAILARLLLPQQFGLVMMVTAVTAVADQFRDLGLSTVTVQRKEITHQQVTNLFWINVFAGIAIALMIGAVSPLVSVYYKEPRLTLITCILATNFVWGGLVVQHEALLARTLKLGHIAVVRVLSSMISVIVAMLLAWKGFGYWALVWKEGVRWALLTLDSGAASQKCQRAGVGSFRSTSEWRQHSGYHDGRGRSLFTRQILGRKRSRVLSAGVSIVGTSHGPTAWPAISGDSTWIEHVAGRGCEIPALLPKGAYDRLYCHHAGQSVRGC